MPKTLKWVEEDGGLYFRGKDGIEFTIEGFDMKFQLCYYRRGIVIDSDFFDYIDDAKDAAQQMYNDMTKLKGYVVPKEEIEENRRKAYKYLF